MFIGRGCGRVDLRAQSYKSHSPTPSSPGGREGEGEGEGGGGGGRGGSANVNSPARFITLKDGQSIQLWIDESIPPILIIGKMTDAAK